MPALQTQLFVIAGTVVEGNERLSEVSEFAVRTKYDARADLEGLTPILSTPCCMLNRTLSHPTNIIAT
jgi:hypothetical protein